MDKEHTVKEQDFFAQFKQVAIMLLKLTEEQAWEMWHANLQEQISAGFIEMGVDEDGDIAYRPTRKGLNEAKAQLSELFEMLVKRIEDVEDDL